jgi:hypothetical protein
LLWWVGVHCGIYWSSYNISNINLALVAHTCTPTQDTENRRIEVRSQPGQIAHDTLSQKHPWQKRVGRVAQSVGLEFKPQHYKKISNFKNTIHEFALSIILLYPLLSHSWSSSWFFSQDSCCWHIEC